MAYEGLEGNKNAEKWTLEEATSFMINAYDLSLERQYDFIGEVAKAQGLYIDIYDYLIDKFPELKKYKIAIKRNCETNCFSNGKKGRIIPSMAIMNLKSNHNWTDRLDNTTKGGSLTKMPDYSNLSNEEIIQLKKLQEKTQ